MKTKIVWYDVCDEERKYESVLPATEIKSSVNNNVISMLGEWERFLSWGYNKTFLLGKCTIILSFI